MLRSMCQTSIHMENEESIQNIELFNLDHES